MAVMPGQPIKFVLKTNGTYAQLSTQMQRLKTAASKYPGLQDPNTTFKMDKPQVNVIVDRAKAAVLGVPVSEVSDTLSVMMGKPVVNFFGVEGYSYEVIPQVFPKFRLNPNDIKGMYVRAENGVLVPLNNLVTITETVAPQSLDEFQQLRSATLDAGIAPGYTMGQVLNFLENYVTHNMPNNFAYDFIGQTREFIHSKGALVAAFIFALVLIYLLLAAHFNSFRDPFIVMLSVPLAIAGAIFVMYLTGSTLNIYTKIGLIMLVGLISKHGILIVDFANKLQEEGRSIRDAVIEAADIRLRPILMTTAAMISGALPLVLSHGAGSIARSQIGWVIIGGMSLGTTLTLFVVPTAYTLLAARVKR